MARTRAFMAWAALGVALVAGFEYWQWTRSPKYALREIREALEQRDAAKFEKYVDVESVASHFFDDLIEYQRRRASSKQGADAIGEAFGAALFELIKPRLVQMSRDAVIRWVESGSWDFSAGEGTERLTDLPLLAEGLGDFKGIGHVKREGKIALVGLDFRNPRLNADLTLELKLRDVGGHWRLVEFANMNQLSERIDSLEAARLEELNASIRSEISKVLYVEPVGLTVEVDHAFFTTSEVYFSALVQNKSDRAIERVSATVRVRAPNGQLINAVEVGMDSLRPLQLRTPVWKLVESLGDLRDVYSVAKTEIEVREILFEDGTRLRVRRSLYEAFE